MLKVLMISSDRNIFNSGSVVAERMKEYGALVGELHIVVLSKKSLGLKEKQLTTNIWAYPTNSLTRWLYVHDAATLGKKIVFDNGFVRGHSLITTQDPFECGWSGLKIKNKLRLPLEVQLHTDPFSSYFTGFINNIRRFIARLVLRHANGVRVITQSLKLKISDLTKEDIIVLPIYIDKKKFEDGKLSFDLHARYPWKFILLAVSRLAPEKNLELTLKILARVREKFPHTGLVIVGSGPEEKKLKKLAQKLGLESSVEFVGWQDNLFSFYKTANVFIQTSLFEGYGLALIEAGLSGLPVVTTAVGFAQELEHGKDAYIYLPRKAELFANGVIDLIENNYKRENLKANFKQTLDSKLISKKEYLQALKSNWIKISMRTN